MAFGSNDLEIKIEEDMNPQVCKSIGGKVITGKDGNDICVFVREDGKAVDEVEIENITPGKVKVTAKGEEATREI